MASKCYGAGKTGGPTHNMGKTTHGPGLKVTASAGKSTGTMRTGDKSGAPHQGQGKK